MKVPHFPPMLHHHCSRPKGAAPKSCTARGPTARAFARCWAQGILETPNFHLQTLQRIVVILKKMELRTRNFDHEIDWIYWYLLIWLELLVVLISGIDYLWLALGSAGAVLRESGGSQQNSKLTSRNKHMTCCFLECSELVVWKKSGFSASFNDQTCFPNRETFQVCCSPPWLNCFHHPWRRLPSLPLCRWGGGETNVQNFKTDI